MSYTGPRPKFDWIKVKDMLGNAIGNPFAGYFALANRYGRLRLVSSNGIEREINGVMNLCPSPNDSSQWAASGAGVTLATTTTSAELPLEGLFGSAIKITFVSGTDNAYFRFKMPAALKGSVFPILWSQITESGYLTGDGKIDVYTNTLANYTGTYTRKALRTDASGVTSIPAGTGQVGQGNAVSFDAGSDDYYEVRIVRVSGTKYLTMNITQCGPGNTGVAPSAGLLQSYTPAYGVGLGTVATINVAWKPNTDTIVIKGRFALGTTTTGLASLGLPNSYTAVAPAGLNSGIRYRCGSWSRENSSANVVKRGLLTYMPGNGYIEFGWDEYSQAVAPSSTLNGTSLGSSGETIYIEAELAISQLVGNIPMIVGAGNSVSYQSNSNSTNTATDTTSFAYGAIGSSIPNGAVGTSYARTVRLQRPYQIGDVLAVLVDQGSGSWVESDRRLGPYVTIGANSYGISVAPTIGSTDVVITFRAGGFEASGVTVGATGTAWSAISTWKWLLAHANPSIPAGLQGAGPSFMGLVAPRKGQYSLTVTGTNYTSQRAVGVYYQDQEGNHRLKFNLTGSVTGTPSTTQLTITGVTFKNVANFYQPVACFGDLAGYGYVNPGNSILTANTVSGTTTAWRASGDVELDAKPSWA